MVNKGHSSNPNTVALEVSSAMKFKDLSFLRKKFENETVISQSVESKDFSENQIFGMSDILQNVETLTTSTEKLMVDESSEYEVVNRFQRIQTRQETKIGLPYINSNLSHGTMTLLL